MPEQTLPGPALHDRVRIDDEDCTVTQVDALTFTVRYDDGETLTWDVGYTPFVRLHPAPVVSRPDSGGETQP